MGTYTSEATKTRIDSRLMVQHLFSLYQQDKRELPKYINQRWHPEIQKIYNDLLSMGIGAPFKPKKIQGSYRHYIYEIPEFDDLQIKTGSPQLYLEDIKSDPVWLSPLWYMLDTLERHTNWNSNIILGPYAIKLNGVDWSDFPYAILIKQGLVNATYVISQHSLSELTNQKAVLAMDCI